MKSLQVIYRAVVMFGTLAVGALAYRAYGPQLEKLEPVLARVQELAMELVANSSSESGAGHEPGEQPPLKFDTAAVPLTPLSEAPRLLDADVRQAADWSDQSPAADAAPEAKAVSASVASVLEQLDQRGVSKYSLSQWGSTGEFYRFECAAPWGTDGRYSRHFEAIAENPAEAAQNVLQQIERWQSSIAHADKR